MPIPIGYLTEALVYISVGACAALPLLLLNVRLAPRLGLIDWPKARGVTEEQIPIVGHSMVLLTLGAVSILMNYYPVSPWFLTTAVVMAAMGHLDDRKPLPPLDKFFFQLVCVSVVVFLDPQVYSAITQKYGSWGTAWAIFFVMGLVNAVNFIDGIDGLAGIVIMMGCVGYLGLSYTYAELYPYAIVAALIMGMMIPFLYLNVMKRKGFLGNVGSYFFSYVLGIMHLSMPIEGAGIIPRLSLSGLCFLIPIADALMVVVARTMTGRSPFYPDKGHLHHRLVQTSINLRYILLNFGLLELASVAVAVVMGDNAGIRTSWLPAVVCVSHIGITTILILLVDKGSRKRVQTYFERLDANEPVFFFKYNLQNVAGAPVSQLQMRRMEARVGAEIRITDLCFIEAPQTLFITLKAPSEPLKSIASRIEAIFHSEKVQVVGSPEQGQYIKATRAEVTPLRRVK